VSCVWQLGRWRILLRLSFRRRYVLRRRRSLRFRDGRLLLFGSCLIRKGTFVSRSIEGVLGGPFRGLSRGSLSFLGLRLRREPILYLYSVLPEQVVLVDLTGGTTSVQYRRIILHLVASHLFPRSLMLSVVCFELYRAYCDVYSE
jgi:hypothetical protein